MKYTDTPVFLEEITIKLARCRELMETKNWYALCLSTQAYFSWITGGVENRVVLASEIGAATILITKSHAYYLTDTIESPRLAPLMDPLPFEPIVYPWHDENEKEVAFTSLLQQKPFAADTPLMGAIPLGMDGIGLLRTLTDTEIEKYKWVGSESAKAVTSVCKRLRRGMTEHQIAGWVSHALMEKGLQPYVLLIAGDEHIASYRHPLPQNYAVQTYVMIVVCARAFGLIANFTRFVAFTELTDALIQKFEYTAFVDTSMIEAFQPDRPYQELFAETQQAYKACHVPEEWQQHHQGGPTGYMGRYFMITPSVTETASDSEAFAFNPSIQGAKSEDTFIYAHGKKLNITRDPTFPEKESTGQHGYRMFRPWIYFKD